MEHTPAAPISTQPNKPTKPVVKYRSKKVMGAVAAKKLGDKVKVEPLTKEVAPVQVKRGRKPQVVQDFNDDRRSISMAIYIEDGLSVEEAGILSGFMAEELSQLQERSDTYRNFVQLQMIKFKQKHLKIIDKAENPSTSQWLLEQKFPEIYGKQANKRSEVGSTQIIQAIVKSVQMTPDTLVPHEHEITEKKESGLNPKQLTEGNKSPFDAGGANIL